MKSESSQSQSQETQNLLDYNKQLEALLPVFRNWTSITINVQLGDHFAYNVDTGSLIIPVEEFANAKYSAKQVICILGHELGHVIQYEEDPNGYLQTFDLEQKLTKSAAEKFLKDHPQFKGTNLSDALMGLYSKYISRLFNCVLDIHANSINRSQNLSLNTDYHSAKVEHDLYDRVLFPADQATDYSQKDPAMAYMDYLLLSQMLPDRTMILPPTVQNARNVIFSMFGSQITVSDFLQKISERKTKVTVINYILENYLAPQMLQILDQELSQIDPNQLEQHIKQKVQTIQDNKSTAPSIPKEIRGKIVQKIKEDKAKSGMKPQQAAEHQQAKQIKHQLEKMGAKQLEVDKIQKTITQVRDIRRQMVGIWNHLLQKGFKTVLSEKTAQPEGYELDISAAIDQWADVISKPGQASVMINEDVRTESNLKPKQINLYLLIDLSGSMAESKEQLIAMQEILIGSLIQFEQDQQLEAQKHPNQSIIHTQIKVIYYGTEAQIPNQIDNPDTLLAIQLYSLRTDLGETQDYQALKTAYDELQNPDLKKATEKGDIVPIVIEITDGDTSTISQSSQVVQQLSKLPGVITAAWKILGDERLGGLSQNPHAAPDDHNAENLLIIADPFRQVWGKYGKELNNWSQLYPDLLDFIKQVTI